MEGVGSWSETNFYFYSWCSSPCFSNRVYIRKVVHLRKAGQTHRKKRWIPIWRHIENFPKLISWSVMLHKISSFIPCCTPEGLIHQAAGPALQLTHLGLLILRAVWIFFFRYGPAACSAPPRDIYSASFSFVNRGLTIIKIRDIKTKRVSRQNPSHPSPPLLCRRGQNIES